MRKGILFFWIFTICVVVVGSCVVWWLNSLTPSPSIKEKSFTLPHVLLDKSREQILSSKDIVYLKKVYEKLVKYSKKSVSMVESSELFLFSGIEKETTVLPKVSLVFVGKVSFAIIDGNVYHKGDRLENGGVVSMITPQGVGIRKNKKIIFLPWVLPERVFFSNLQQMGRSEPVKKSKEVKGEVIKKSLSGFSDNSIVNK